MFTRDFFLSIDVISPNKTAMGFEWKQIPLYINVNNFNRMVINFGDN